MQTALDDEFVDFLTLPAYVAVLAAESEDDMSLPSAPEAVFLTDRLAHWAEVEARTDWR